MKKQQSAWYKLEQAIEQTHSFVSSRPSAKRCLSANNRDTQKHHQSRSMSNYNELLFNKPRPNSNRSSFSASHPLVAVQSLTNKEIQLLFKAKCYDLHISETADQESRFRLFCNSNLQHREFKYCELGVSTDSARIIGKILKNNPNFAFLNLSKNRLKDEGSLILLKNLKKSKALAHLDLCSNDISEKGMEKCLLELVGNESIVSLNLSSQGQIRKNRLGTGGCRSLSTVLSENRVLSFLNLASTGITQEGLEILLEGLSKNSTLLSLNLLNNSITSKATETLARVLSNCELIELSIACNNIGNEGCEYFGKLLSYSYGQYCMLTKLDLSENKIGAAGLSKIFKALRNNTQLAVLNLSKNNFSKGLSSEFLEFLYENSTLNTLDLTACCLIHDSLTGMAEGLSRNFGLKELIFANNFIQDTENLAAGLLKNQVLEVLDLSNNKLRDKAVISLIDSIKSHSTLHTLVLKENCLQDECGKVLLDLVRKKKQIISVNLDFNPLSVKHYKEIKEILKKNFVHKKKQVVPTLRKAIDKIYADNSELEALHYKIMSLDKQKHEFESKAKVEGFKLEHIKQLELQQLKELIDQYTKLKNYSQSLSVQIEEINNDHFVIHIKKSKLLNERTTQELSFKIKSVDIEISTLEEKSEV